MKLQITFLLISIWGLMAFSPTDFNDKKAHAFHVSKTDMVFKPTEKTLQITMHIFIDDLELALEKQGFTKLFIGTEKEKTEVNSLITNYLVKNFQIKINDKNTAYTWIGKEPAADLQALWVYLEVKNVKDIKSVQVDNRVLTEAFADQKNIVQINVPTKKQGYFLLDRSKNSDKAVF